MRKVIVSVKSFIYSLVYFTPNKDIDIDMDIDIDIDIDSEKKYIWDTID